MSPKAKKAKHRVNSDRKRSKNSSESSTDSSSPQEHLAKDEQVAIALEAPRKTRASARACKDKMRGSRVIDAAIEAQEENSNKIDKYDFVLLTSSDSYNHPEMVRKMTPQEFTMDYYHDTGLSQVLLFDCRPEELGMKMVDENFTPRDVEQLVGGDRMVSCVRVNSQSSVEMPLSKFLTYYYTPQDERTELYNVLSLEFSNTALADKVQSPSLVREIDWASDWPDERKGRSIVFKDKAFEITNHYPRVENYCLMSPTACYTDFHIDFHGTSVWYHVKRGQKIFWIVEPTEQNVKMYEEFLRNEDQSGFFGDVPDKCHRVVLMPGNTLIIPSGWIHAVYTPVDSLVFGGNFLHIRAATMQIKVLQSEKRIGVNKKYRYPYSEEALFFYMARLVKEVTGRKYIRPQTKNRQMESIEYIGEQFHKKGGHRRLPKREDYEEGGCAWKETWDESDAYVASTSKLEKHEVKEEEEEEEEKKENGDDGGRIYGEPQLNSDGLEEEAPTDEDEEGDKTSLPTLSPQKGVMESGGHCSTSGTTKDGEKKDEEEQRTRQMPGGHDDFFIDDVIFYHPLSFNLDSGRTASSMHNLPLSSAEPPLKIDHEVLARTIHPMMVPELEFIIKYTLKKGTVDLPSGLTRPNSLLNALSMLVVVRRTMAMREGFPLPPTVLFDLRSRAEVAEHRLAAEASRKKRAADRKAREEGELDDDWDPDNEERKQTKRARRSEDGGTSPRGGVSGLVRAILVNGEAREGVMARPSDAVPNKSKWNKGFGAWYKAHRKALAPEYPNMCSIEQKQRMRIDHFTKLTKEEKQLWIDRALEDYDQRVYSESGDEWSRGRASGSSQSSSSAALPSTSIFPSNPHVSALARSSTDGGALRRQPAKTPLLVSPVGSNGGTPSMSSLTGTKKHVVKAENHEWREGAAADATVPSVRYNQQRREQERIVQAIMHKHAAECGNSTQGRPASAAPAVSVVCTDDEAMKLVMQRKFVQEGRLMAAATGGPSSRRPAPSSSPSLEPKFSPGMINHIAIFVSRPSHRSLIAQIHSEGETELGMEEDDKIPKFVKSLNNKFKTNFTPSEIVKYISELKGPKEKKEKEGTEEEEMKGTGEEDIKEVPASPLPHSSDFREAIDQPKPPEDVRCDDKDNRSDLMKDRGSWSWMKRSQEQLVVKRHTASSSDWTAFDVYLEEHYKKICTRSNKRPTNEYVLMLKRDIWDAILTKADVQGKYEKTASLYRQKGKPRLYWGSQSVVEQEDRVVQEGERQLLPLGGENISSHGALRNESFTSQPHSAIKNEHVDLDVEMKKEAMDEEMIDVEAVEESANLVVKDEPSLEEVGMEGGKEEEDEEGEAEMDAHDESTPSRKKSKGGRPKKDATSDKKKKKEKAEDFMQKGPRQKGKKVKPDPTKPLIIDGVPVNPLAEPAVANVYGYDPAMDLVPLGQGQLKSAYRRGKAQLDTPQMDAKRYKLEVKHDHLLDDEDHDDTHRDDVPEGEEREEGGDDSRAADAERIMAEGLNMQGCTPGDEGASQSPSLASHPQKHQYMSTPFSRRPAQSLQKAAPPLIPHAPSPLAARRKTVGATDGGGWGKGGGGGNGRRRSDAGDRRDIERTPGNRSPGHKPSSSPYSPNMSQSVTASSSSSSGNGLESSTAGGGARHNRLSQAEKFTMAAPRVIDAPRLATPAAAAAVSLGPKPAVMSDPLITLSFHSINGDDSTLPSDVFCSRMDMYISDLERANATLGSGSNGH